MAEPYDIGDRPRITTTFTDLDRVLTDPASVVCRVKRPDGVTVTYTHGVDTEVTRTSTGIYNLDVRLTHADKWSWKWDAGSSLILTDSSVQGRLNVRRSRV